MMNRTIKRMMFDEEITRDEINKLELKSYEGKVVLVSKLSVVISAINEIEKYPFVGFDTETKPTFKKGDVNQVSLVQIALPHKVFLIRINKTGLSKHIIDFLENRHINKVGISPRDDIQGLKLLGDFDPVSFIDLNTVVLKLGIKSQGLRKLTALILGFRISKTQQTSNWEKNILNDKQIKYAATDAWCCSEIYQKLENLGYC